MEVLVGLFVICLAGWFFIPAMGRNRTRAAREACLAHLGEIGRALGAYLRDSEDRWPYVAKLRTFKLHDPPWPTLPEVLGPYLAATGDSIFRCPADARELAAEDPLLASFPRSTTYFETEGLSYAWYWSDARGGKKVGLDPLASGGGFGKGRADQALLTDFEPFHKGDGGGALNTLFADLKARPSRGRGEH